MELTFHDGTIRDLVFIQDMGNRTSLLISGGAGDSKIYVTDCETAMPVRAMAGHTGRFYCTFAILILQEFTPLIVGISVMFIKLRLIDVFCYYV